MEKMQLLTFAHKKEAQSFIDYFSLTKADINIPGLYSNDKRMLITTGEGVFNTMLKLTAILAYYKKITKIINLGIAGSASEKINLHTIHQVRISLFYLPEISKSFRSSAENVNIDCVSVLMSSQAEDAVKHFKNSELMVDMEAWGVASVADFFNLPFYSAKFISDNVYDKISPKSIIKKAKYYSESLLEYYHTNFEKL